MTKARLLTFIVVLLTTGGSGRCALIELEFSGAVNWVVTAEELRGQLPVEGVVAVGDSISGILRYDTLAVDQDPDEDRGTYIYNTAPNGISITVNEHVFVSDPESLNFEVSVVNEDNHMIPHDAWYASSLSNLSILDGYAAITNILFAAGASPYKLMDDSLLTTEQELSGWQMQLYIGGVGGDDKVLSFRGDITSLSLVPPPAIRHVPDQYATIQAAIDECNDGDTVVIAPGMYTGDGNWDIDFLGKAITVRSADPNDPSIVAATVIDCNGSEADWHRGFIFDGNEGPDSILDGLTIIRGRMSTTPTTPLILEEASGGAIACFSASPTIRNCTIGNSHALAGGGIFLMRGNARIVNCQFAKNTAVSGGALYCQGANFSLSRCTFLNNFSGGGGALSAHGSRVHADGCRFTANVADGAGGALAASLSDALLNNCLLTGNSASYGGAVMCEPGPVTVVNCTITGNIARRGSGIMFFPAPISHDGSSSPGPGVSVINSIVRGNSPRTDEQTAPPYGAAPNFSCIEGLNAQAPGIGNIEADPCFADPGYWDPNGTPGDVNDDFWVDGDYHLKSQAGRWDAGSGRWVRDDVTSPCIDAGDPMSPIGLEAFPNGGIINMGAYGGTAEASKSWFGGPVCETVVAGDVNGDCVVDYRDFAILALHWLEEQ